MYSANAISTVLQCGRFKEKMENRSNSEITPSRGKESFCAYWKETKYQPTPPTKPEKLTLSKKTAY